MRYNCSRFVQIFFQVHENVTSSYCTSKTRLPQVTPQTSSTNFSQTHSWAVQSWGDQSMEATTPELGPVSFWSPKSSIFSGSDSIASRRNFLSRRPSINKSERSELLDQNHKVEAFKLRRYLQTCHRALEQFLQPKTSPKTPLLRMLLERGKGLHISTCKRAVSIPHPPQYS